MMEEKLEKAPNSLIFISLAKMYFDSGMLDETVELCEAGLEIESENEEANFIIAQVEIKKGKKEEAIKRLVGILEKNPGNSVAKKLLEQLENQIDTEKKGKELIVKVQTPPVMLIEKEVAEPEEKTVEMKEERDQIAELFIDKIKRIVQIKGVINSFFRLKNGRIIKTSELIANIEELSSLLDSLLSSVDSAGEELKMGKPEIILIEIERGVFYIFGQEDYNCLLLSHNTDNFGLVKAILPRILGETSIAIKKE